MIECGSDNNSYVVYSTHTVDRRIDWFSIEFDVGDTVLIVEAQKVDFSAAGMCCCVQPSSSSVIVEGTRLCLVDCLLT